MEMKFYPAIGLEVHVHLKTKTKLFCSCANEFGAPPNTNICPICTGQPGVLPAINKKAVELALRTAIALNFKISHYSVFARKNYFYPDLPKNYQISQYELPLGKDGYLEINLKESVKKIRIQRIHLEEDAGKLLHAIGSQELHYSLVDFNRAGIPLLEIVTAPDITSPEEAYLFLQELKKILQYLEVSDCDMEKGNLRCDANVSVSTKEGVLGVKTEVKNMNSFKAIKEALSYEINRQVESIKSGEKIIQETRLWNDKTSSTSSMRTKEYAHDYRYFPEPDLPPMEFTNEWIEEIRNTLPELPQAKLKRFEETYKLSHYDATVLTEDKNIANFYEDTVKELSPLAEKINIPKEKIYETASNWITTELLGYLNKAGVEIKDCKITPKMLAELVSFIFDGTISGKIAKTVFSEMCDTGEPPRNIITKKGLIQITDENALLKIIEEVIRENAKAVEEYKSGKEKALGALVGAVMKKTMGRANPQVVNKLLKEQLK
jgi:aspartyl-tRNA(Asn)/glutamyl-tRNA(Gln) amidotransferase subunit B